MAQQGNPGPSRLRRRAGDRAQPYTVEGLIRRPDGSPLPGLVVRAEDRALAQWRVLGDAENGLRTDGDGRYRIAYRREQLAQWGKRRADLRVEVRDPTGDTVLATSPIVLQARPAERIDVNVGDEPYRGPDEYSAIDGALAPRLGTGASLAGIEVADVLILARDTGLASSHLAYAVTAHRWAAQGDLPAPVWYGLMRESESSRRSALLARCRSCGRCCSGPEPET